LPTSDGRDMQKVKTDEFINRSFGPGVAATVEGARLTSGVAKGATHLAFRDLWNTWSRRRKFILNTSLLGTLFALIITLLLPAKYTAKAQLLMEPDGAEAIDTHLAMLTSLPFLDYIVSELQAQAPPSTTTPLSRFFVSTGIPSRDVLERNLMIQQERRSRVITVAYTASHPAEAAKIANQVAKFYVARRSQQRQSQDRAEFDRISLKIIETRNTMERSRNPVQGAIENRPPGEDQPGDPQRVDRAQDAAASSELIGRLLRRQGELQEQIAAAAADVRLLSVASAPDRPSSHSPLLFLFPAVVLLSIGGFSLAHLLERLDGRIWDVEDAREAIGLPCIGSLPDISSTLTNAAAATDDARAPAAFQEVLRSLVAELHLADPVCDIKTLLITSSLEREGRTTLAYGLAACLACLGRKAIVVDCDVRHESLLQQHGANEHVEEMRDDALAQLIEHADGAGHDVLQLPRCGIDPMALFASGRLQDLFATLRRTYDSVVIDGPPLLIATEARLLPALADATIIAVRWGSTNRSDVLSALAAIRGVGFGCRVEIDEHVTVMTCEGEIALRGRGRRDSRSVPIAASRRTS